MGRGRNDNGIGPIYNPAFLQRGHGIGSISGELWRSFECPLLWQGAKAVASEVLVRGPKHNNRNGGS